MDGTGIKIKNIEASTLLEYNHGIREHYETKDAIFADSLFGSYLMENGLKIQKNGSTKDLICLEFNFGSRSYQAELDHLHRVATTAVYEYKHAKIHRDFYSMEKAGNKRRKISELLNTAYQNRKKYQSLTKEQIRNLFYNEGTDVEYITCNKSGEIRKTERIHYRMLYRSTGKAKKGSCMFIRDKLYKKSMDFLYMGIRLPAVNPMIVEISAYAPLVSSSIVGTLKIHPENILILKDVDRFFETNVISIETDEDRHCMVKRREQYLLKNTLFDGQALIDSSIFPDWANGYLLLRHHFCKMAAFHTNIQQFFKDYFGDSYSTATVTDMFGVKHYVRDIELITTDNSMKWIKFGKSYEYWCKKVRENQCTFGIVKTAHESKLGDMQKMSYQMVNSLDMSTMRQVVQTSADYVNKLKSDDREFLHYLESKQNFSNDYEVLLALCRQNERFTQSSYYRSRKKKIIEAYVLKLKTGELIQNAENLTVVGSPYAMLLYATTRKPSSVDEDDTLVPEPGTIQCYTERFDCGEYLAFFRSPFNSKNNLTYLHNTRDRRLEKYFHLGRQIIAINMIGTDAQDRNNGMDMDSDFGYTTNQPNIVEHARRCYQNYPTIVNNIPKEKNTYSNTMDDYANIDNSLAKSQADIGEASNLAQLAQTYDYNFDNPKYSDAVCVLSVLAQVAIDNAKRRFDIDLTQEIRQIKSELDIPSNQYPKFWQVIKKGIGSEHINRRLQCPMNYLYDLNLERFRSEGATLPLSDFFCKHELDENRVKCRKVEALIEKYSLQLFDYNTTEKNTLSRDDTYLLLRNDFEELIRDIRKTYISRNYIGLMSWLIDRAFMITPNVQKNNKTIKSKIRTNKSLLLKVLYDVNPEQFLRCFSKND